MLTLGTIKQYFNRRRERRELTYQALSDLGPSTDVRIGAEMLSFGLYPRNSVVLSVVQTDLNALTSQERVRRIADDIYEVVK